MNQVPRYDADAARNIVARLRREMPEEYAILMAQIKAQAGLAGLGQNEPEESSGWWSNILDLGTSALTTIATYKLQREENKQAQKTYDDQVQAELSRQALLAEQAATQRMEYEQQMALQKQTRSLLNAASRSKSTFNWAIAAAGALGLILVWRMVG